MRPLLPFLALLLAALGVVWLGADVLQLAMVGEMSGEQDRVAVTLNEPTRRHLEQLAALGFGSSVPGVVVYLVRREIDDLLRAGVLTRKP